MHLTFFHLHGLLYSSSLMLAMVSFCNLCMNFLHLLVFCGVVYRHLICHETRHNSRLGAVSESNEVVTLILRVIMND